MYVFARVCDQVRLLKQGSASAHTCLSIVSPISGLFIYCVYIYSVCVCVCVLECVCVWCVLGVWDGGEGMCRQICVRAMHIPLNR